MPVQLPEAELRELAEILDSGELSILRDRSEHPRYVRQDLTRYTDRVWLFPFGGDPDQQLPVDVFVNGLVLARGEFELVRVGSREPVTALVFDRPVGIDEHVTSTYTALPRAGR